MDPIIIAMRDRQANSRISIENTIILHYYLPALLNQVLAMVDSAARPSTKAAAKENLIVPDLTKIRLTS